MLGFCVFASEQVRSEESSVEATAMLSVSRVAPYTDPPVMANWVEVDAHRCSNQEFRNQQAATQYDCEQIAISAKLPFYQYNSKKGLCATCPDGMSLTDNIVHVAWQVYRNPALWPLKSMGQKCTGKKKSKQPAALSQIECQLAADSQGHPYYQWNANKNHCSTAKKCSDEAASSSFGTYYRDLVLDQPDASNPCLSWNFAASMDPALVGTAIGPVLDPSYKLTKFEIQEPGGADRAHLYSKNGICWLSFQNTDTTFANAASDWNNNMNWAPEKKWGFTGLHTGLVRELEGLIELMDFNAMHAECSDSLSVTGWSLGGSLAQLFAVVMNAAHNPLHSDLRVKSVHSFGAFAPMSDGNDQAARNDQAADGCFAGNQYYVAYPSKATGGYAADVVYSKQTGSDLHSFPHSNKVFVMPDGSQQVFPCDTPLPQGVDLFLALNPTGGSDWSQYLQAHASYPVVLGCVAPP